MTTAINRIYEISHAGDKIVFSSRGVGDQGRDIAVIKYALGDIYQSEEVNRSPSDTTIGRQWFSCDTDKPLSTTSLITFDKKLKKSLMSFQIQNQFLFLNYYWEKLGIVGSISDEKSTYQAIQASLRMFDSEFGRIGEATIAVLHSWRPNSVSSNRSFFNEVEYPVEQVPAVMYEMITSGAISPIPEGVVRRISRDNPESATTALEELREMFNTSSSSVKKWKSRVPALDSYYVEYVALSTSSSITDSLLYTSTKEIISILSKPGIYDLTPARRAELISKAFEPDHLTSTKPFDIDNFKIGFFDKTVYTFMNLPNFSNLSSEVKVQLESSAATKVLQFYNISPASEVPQELINFIEFRAPSLRPGDVYRAYFEIDRRILDSIESVELSTAAASVLRVADNQSLLEEEIRELENEYCIGGKDLSDEDVRVQYEKYRSFAAKKKLEISRKIRNAAFRAREDQLDVSGIDIDLGIFGRGTLTEGELKGFLTSGALNIAAAAGEGIDSLLEGDKSKKSGSHLLTITYNQLVRCAASVSSNFESAAKEMEDYTFPADEFFKVVDEAHKIARLPAEIEDQIRRSKFVKDKIESYGPARPSLKEFLEKKDTELQITFRNSEDGTGSTIESIYLSYYFSQTSATPSLQSVTVYSATETQRFGESEEATANQRGGDLNEILSRPRTVHYLRNIKDLCPESNPSIANFFQGAICDGEEFAGPGKDYVLKHTLNISEKAKENQYNPWHNWKQETTKNIKDRLPKASNKKDRLFKTTNPTQAFGFENALPMISTDTELDFDDIGRQFGTMAKKKLLCEYLACLGLPSFSLQLPDLSGIDWPKLPTIEFPGLKWEDWWNLIKSLVIRALAALLKGILDILKTPLCQDKFIEEIYGAASDVSPDIQRALADGFLDTGLPPGVINQAKDFIAALMNILSPNEICALLNGDTVNDEVYHVVRGVAESFNLQTYFSTDESIQNFFITLGFFVGPEICAGLSRYELDRETCSDVYGLLNQIRSAASRGENVSPEDIEAATAAAEEDLMRRANALELLGNGSSLADMFPDLNSLENNPIFSEPSDIIASSADTAARAALDLAKNSFATTLNSYVSYMYVNSPGIAGVDDEGYNSEANLKVHRAVCNMQRFAKMDLNLSNLSEIQTTLDLRRALLTVCDDYERVMYAGASSEPFEIYEINSPSDNPTAAHPESLLKGSLLGKYNLSDEQMPNSDRGQLSRLSELSAIWSKLFPISAGDLDDKTRTMSSYLDWGKPEFKGGNNLSSADIITLNTGYLNKINQVMLSLQDDISANTAQAFVNKTDSVFLGVVKQFYERTDVGRSQELITVTTNNQGQIKTTFKHPVERLQDMVEIESTDDSFRVPAPANQESPLLIKNTVTVKDDFFLGTSREEKLVFSFCEQVPERLNSLPMDESVRKNSYADIIKNSLTENALKYQPSRGIAPRTIIDNTPDVTADLKGISFSNMYEGTIEQLSYYIGQSRIFSDPDYVTRLDLKLRSKFYFDPSLGCYRNPNNLLKYGALNFDNIVSDMFSEEYIREFADPTNSPLVEDYSTPGAFDKAMMNTSLVGFIRIALIELLLKGAVCFSVWDIDFIRSNEFFRKYVFEFVKRQIELQAFFTEKRLELDECISRVSGTNNVDFGLKKIVLSEVDGLISDISKNLFENDARTNFSSWFLDKMPLISVPESRNEEGTWITNLSKEEIFQFSQNNFSFLEKYIRINGPLRDFNSSNAQIASAQYSKLMEHLPSIEQITNNSNLSLPNVSEYDIANPDSIDVNTYEDNDSSPNTELLSVREFSEVIRSLTDNNKELSKFTHELQNKIHDPFTESVHGLPRTLERNMPSKAIIRTRKRFEFSKANVFSALFKQSPSIPTHEDNKKKAKIADKFATKFVTNNQKKDAYFFNTITTGDPESSYGINTSNDSTMTEALRESFSTAEEYETRYYLMPGDIRELLPQADQVEALDARDRLDFSTPYVEPRVDDESGNRLAPHDTRYPGFFPSSGPTLLGDDFVSFGGRSHHDAVFINQVGKVPEETFQDFVDSNPEFETETWEETIIDLVADASPIFNQPGQSQWDPEDHLSDADQEQIGSLLDRQMWLAHNSQVEITGVEFGEANPEKARLLNATEENIGLNPDRFIFKITEKDETTIKKAVPCGKFGQISNTTLEKYHTMNDDGFSQTYATNSPYFERDIDGVYRADREQELLGLNEYKIPIRMLITQVKDSSGNILKVFTKYILPEFLDFKNEELDNYRAGKLKGAILDTLRAWENFNKDGFRKLMIEKFVNNPSEYNKYSYLFSDPSNPSTSGLGINSDIHKVLAQGYGAGALPVPPIMRYPGTVDGTVQAKPSNSSRKASWCSTSKFYSLACQKEAEEKIKTFRSTQAHIDKQFSHPGHLMRKPTGNFSSYSEFKSFMLDKVFATTREDVFTSDNANYQLNAQLRQLYINKNLSRHWVYDEPLHNMFSTFAGTTVESLVSSAGRKTIQTIGNMVSWFNQRSPDAFWGHTSGRTTVDLVPENRDFVAGNIPPSRVSAGFLDRGPSLFYNDNRIGIYSFLNSISNLPGSRIRQTYTNARTALKTLTDIREGYWYTPDTTLSSGYTEVISPVSDTSLLLRAETRVQTELNLRTASFVIYTINASTIAKKMFSLTEEEAKQSGLWLNESEVNIHQEVQSTARANATIAHVMRNDLQDYRRFNLKNMELYRAVAAVITGRYNAALEEIGLAPIIREITSAYVSNLEGDETIVSDILEDSEISYGYRLMINNRDHEIQEPLNEIVKDLWTTRTRVSEEERMGSTRILDITGAQSNFTTIPVSSYELNISSLECFMATNSYMFRQKLKEQEKFMKDSLQQQQSFKDFYEFTIPYKNFAAMLTVHGTSMLAGFGDMPTVMESTKASLAAAFNASSVLDPFATGDFGSTLTAADVSSIYGPLGPAGGSPPECFDLPNFKQFLKLVAEMIKQYVLYFPSIVLRGIADGIDPMYKEMKHHYLDCQIQDLTNGSWAASSGAGDVPLGLRGSQEGEKKYAPIIPAFPVDLAKGVSRAFRGDVRYLGKSIDKLVGFIYGAPKVLLDPAFAFKIPCLSISQDLLNDWKKFEIGNSGRYGFPMTPISLLALQTLQLPADMDLKNNLCPKQIAEGCEDELE